MLADYAKLAVKNLTHRQLRSWLTMIGIFIGIATVVSLITLGAGLKAAVAAQFSSLGADKLVIEASGGIYGPPGQGTATQLTEKDLTAVKRTQYVVAAAGRLLKPVEVNFDNKAKALFMASIPEDPQERELVLSATNLQVQEGRIPKKGDGFFVTIGNGLASSDLFGRPVMLGDVLTVQGKKVKVIGIMERRGSVQYDNTLFMIDSSMREVLGLNETVKSYSVISAQVTSPEQIDLAKDAVEKSLRTERGETQRNEDFTVQTPQSILSTLDTVIGGITAVLVGIAAISLVVGGVGIMNTMYTAVLERTREIGVMKAVGATNEAVLTLFLFESGLLGLAGGIIGVILGIIFSQLVVAIGTAAIGPGLLRADISLPLIFGALAFSFVVGSLAGTLPAYEAARLEPVEALQK